MSDLSQTGPTDLAVQLGVQVAAVYATSFLSTYLVRELDTSRQKIMHQVEALRRMAYQGPRLFEIPPGPDIWERLERSRDYLNQLEKGS